MQSRERDIDGEGERQSESCEGISKLCTQLICSFPRLMHGTDIYMVRQRQTYKDRTTRRDRQREPVRQKQRDRTMDRD